MPRGVSCRTTAVHRQSRLPPFHVLFPAAPSCSSNSSSPASSRRFPIVNVDVNAPISTVGEGDGSSSTGERSDRQLGWLRHNLRHLAGGRNSRSRRPAQMPEGSPQWPRYVFSARSCGYMYDPPNDSKLAFVTPDNYCHLCHEPVEVAIRHCAWWDHVTRQAAVRLIAIQPRRWDATAVLQQAQNDLPASVMETPRPHPFLAHSPISVDADDPALVDMSTCYVFEREAVVRRAELAAILRVLCTTQTATIESCNSASDKGSDGVSSRPLLFHSLFPSPGGSPAANVGERTFRAYISRQISVLLPPMAPEPTTRIQQRCWGRKNLEMMFDLLGVASLQKLVGVPTVAATKNEKATVIRQVVYELATVLSEKHVVASSNASCTGSDLDAVDTAEQTRLLVELALQRLAHELIHLHTMLLMEQAWGTYAALGFPTESVVEASSFC